MKALQTISDAVKQNYYPSLNGLRGLSIILVVFGHLHCTGYYYNLLFNGGLGVNIFFVLSGFLITTICLKEIDRTGKLSLKNFYIRRFLRIFPVAYLYLLVVFILNYFFKLEVPGFQFLGAMFYVMDLNYFREHQYTWVVEHYWSLSVEEQFYIIFPFILQKNVKVFTWSIVFIVAVLPVLCTIQKYYPPLNGGAFYGFTHYLWKFQSIAVGCLCAVLASKKVFDVEWIRSTKIAGNLIAFFLIFYLNYYQPYLLKAVYTDLAIALLTGYIVISNILPAKDFIFRILNTKVLSAIGILSYSIYIWQQIFTTQDSNLPKYMTLFPYNLIWIAVVSSLSYYFYEQYFLRLKSKFSEVKTVPLKIAE